MRLAYQKIYEVELILTTKGKSWNSHLGNIYCMRFDVGRKAIKD